MLKLVLFGNPKFTNAKKLDRLFKGTLLKCLFLGFWNELVKFATC